MKKVSKFFKIILYAFLMIMGCFIFVKNLLFLNEVNTNYIEINAIILKYRNYGENLYLDSKKSFALFGEEFVLGYTFNEKAYETDYSVIISDDYNNREVGTPIKIKINPQNPEKIFLMSDRSYFIFVVAGILIFSINIVLFAKKISTKETDGY